MTRPDKASPISRLRAVLLLCAPLALLAGCSPDVASTDDVYVPATSEERFPIQVLEMPVKMTVLATSGDIPAEDMTRLAGFARAARQDGSSPVSVRYPSGSAKARDVSLQAVRALVRKGVPRARIHTASYNGKSDVVSLSFTRTVAATKECGDWSRNLANDPRNEPFPNHGCALQNNFAAMAENPEDFEQPRAMEPAYARGRMLGMEKYSSGTWTKPIEGPDTGEIGN